MANVEKNTNQLFRKKYFVEANEVIRSKPLVVRAATPEKATIIPREKVELSSIRVPINAKRAATDAQMQIKVIRDQNNVTGIKIACPCGRHADIDLQYHDKVQTK